MEVINAIVTALALGAATVTTEAASKAIKNAYAGLKAVIAHAYPKVSVDFLEQEPESKHRRDLVEEELQATDAARNRELLALAIKLTDLVQQHAPSAATAIGVDLKHVEAASLRLADIAAVGTGMRIEHGTFTGDIEIRNVRSGKNTGFEFRIKDSAEANVRSQNQTRMIDANLFAERLMPGEIATLTIIIRLPRNPSRGKWQDVLTFDPGGGPVQLTLVVRGFTLLSEPPPPFHIPNDRDTPPLAFELRIEAEDQRWLHLMFSQGGRPIGELTISNFSNVSRGPALQTSRSQLRSVAEADLMLVVRPSDGQIEASSPRERASLDHVTIKGFQYPTTPFRDLLADRLRALYDERSDPKETAREMRIVGAELAGCLPSDMVRLLRRPDIRSVMLRHEDDFDFPLELCYLDDKDDPFFVGDRIAICRWYLGVTNLPDILVKQVRKVAFLRGSADAFKADEELLNRLFPGRAITLTRRSDIVEKLFKTSDFDVIHFTGHCRQQDKASGGLELADGTFLRLIEIGQLEAERAFADAQPFVMLNACASAQPYLGLTQRGSFAHRFITSNACAVVGTLWPVSGPIANEFAEHFYGELASKPIGQALLAAKLALIHEDTKKGNDASMVSEKRRLARQVAGRSYCLFANPDLRFFA